MRAAPLGILLLLGACNAPDKADKTPSDAMSATPAAQASTPTAAATSPANPATDKVARRVVLDAKGLSTGGPDASFGADRAAVDSQVAAALDRPVEKSALQECGAGPMDFSKIGGLTLNYQEGKFVGWFARTSEGLVTSDGIRPGLTIAELKRERPVAMLDTTLDGEFAYTVPDGTILSGFAKGKGDDAIIMSLHAGTNCFFR